MLQIQRHFKCIVPCLHPIVFFPAMITAGSYYYSLYLLPERDVHNEDTTDSEDKKKKKKSQKKHKLPENWIMNLTGRERERDIMDS